MSLSGPLLRQRVLCVIAASSHTADAAYINCVTSGVGASYSYMDYCIWVRAMSLLSDDNIPRNGFCWKYSRPNAVTELMF